MESYEVARLSRKYDKPATSYERLLASDKITDEQKDRLRQSFAALDPIQFLSKRARHTTGLRNSKRALRLLNRRRPTRQSINLSGIWGQLGSRERFAPLTGNGMRYLGPGELAKILLKLFGRPSNNG
jgi:hypothetical protein